MKPNIVDRFHWTTLTLVYTALCLTIHKTTLTQLYMYFYVTLNVGHKSNYRSIIRRKILLKCKLIQ